MNTDFFRLEMLCIFVKKMFECVEMVVCIKKRIFIEKRWTQ